MTWPTGAAAVRVLRRSEEFLPTHLEPGSIVIRDCEGVLGVILDTAGADGVLLRPDRHVLAYLPRGAGRTVSAVLSGTIQPRAS